MAEDIALTIAVQALLKCLQRDVNEGLTQRLRQLEVMLFLLERK